MIIDNSVHYLFFLNLNNVFLCKKKKSSLKKMKVLDYILQVLPGLITKISKEKYFMRFIREFINKQKTMFFQSLVVI